MTSNQPSYNKKHSIIQWRNGSGNDSANALPTSIAIMPPSKTTSHNHNNNNNNDQLVSVNGKSIPNNPFVKSRVRPPSLVWEGIGGHLTGGVTAPTSPRITAMGVATTVNATAEAIFSQQIAGTLSTSSNENCRSDGVTPTPPTSYQGSDNHVSSKYPPLSYQPPSITRENSVLNSLECWDYSVELECLQGPNDLQLAAELGKTLLERNKELENNLKEQQAIIDDQTQEIEHLTKQNTTLREINDSRVKVYEQLEVSIIDLEATNKQLIEESKADKSRIKSLCSNINRLDARYEDLQRCLEEARLKLEAAERQNKASNQKPGSQLVRTLSHSESSTFLNGFSVEGIANAEVAASEEESNHEELNFLAPQKPGFSAWSEKKAEIHRQTPSDKLGDHACESDSQEYDDRVPSLNEDTHSGTCPGVSKKLHSHMHATKATVSLSPSDCSMVSSTKSEDSGYENGEFQQQCHFNLKQGIDTCQNVTSSSSSSYSPAPKSSSSCSRVGSAFSDSLLESEEPVSLGTDMQVNRNDHSLHSPALQTLVEKDGTYSTGISHKSDSIGHLQLEISEAKLTITEMERAVSDLRTENLRLRLDLGVKNDPGSVSADDSLRSVDEEVQEVAAVRAGKLCRRCLGINDATPGALIDKAMDLMGETLVSELEQHFGSPSMSWVSNIKSSRLWLDVWLAGLCVFAFFIALVYRAFEASSSLTHELAGSL